jgi:glycosyltransferase involved in cell wall biosynthesis
MRIGGVPVYDARTLNHSTRGTREAPRIGGPLSVAYFSPAWPPGTVSNGIVSYVGTISEALRARGNVVSVLAPAAPTGVAVDEEIYRLGEDRGRRTRASRLLDRLEARISPRRALDRMTCRTIVAGIRRAIAERDVQLFEMEESYGWSYRVQRRIPVPVIVRLHGPWFLSGPINGYPSDRSLRRRVREEGLGIRMADGITSPSRDVLERTRAQYGLELEQAEVIPPPTPDIPAAECWRPAASESHRILFIGRFDSHKGGDVIIDAYAKVVERIPHARLRFVGLDQGLMVKGGRRWAIRDYLDDRVPGWRQGGRVEWLDQQPYSALAGLRREAAVTVVCSRYETFSLTVAEAMSVGCPIVASRTGGISEQIAHEVNGLLCEPGDANDLADKLCYILNNPALAAQLGQRARHDCVARLSPAAVSAKIAAFYARVLSDSRNK